MTLMRFLIGTAASRMFLAPECLRCLRRLSPSNYPIIFGSPQGAVRTYPRLLDRFRGQSKIPSDNTVYKEEILSPPRQAPLVNYRRPTDFMGLSTWNGPRVTVSYCPHLIIPAATPLTLSALLCHAPCHNNRQAGAQFYLPTAPHRAE